MTTSRVPVFASAGRPRHVNLYLVSMAYGGPHISMNLEAIVFCKGPFFSIAFENDKLLLQAEITFIDEKPF